MEDGKPVIKIEDDAGGARETSTTRCSECVARLERKEMLLDAAPDVPCGVVDGRSCDAAKGADIHQICWRRRMSPGQPRSEPAQ